MLVILDNIRSVYNVGSIFRTADAAGIKKIYLCGITPAPTDKFGRPRPQFTKVSLGAEKYIDWKYCKSTHSINSGLILIQELKKQSFKIFAIEQHKKAIPYYKLKTQDLKQKTAIILGNEIKGLPSSILKQADKILEIPIYGKKESLNVAVAFGIIAFHLLHGN